MQEWGKLRKRIFQVLSMDVFETSTALTGTSLLEYETMALHHYIPHEQVSGHGDYSPPHKDGGTLTILVREGKGPDGLEVADLDTATGMESAKIGREASFLPVPIATDEVVVFLGTRMQRLLGQNVVRACVHRVRASIKDGSSSPEARFSAAIFCAPPL